MSDAQAKTVATSATPVAERTNAMLWQERLAYWLQLFCRYFIGTVLLIYASGKIFETQFSVEPSALDTPVRFLSGFEFAWIFYGYSYTYGLFLAGAQIAAALFLFFQRTVRLGLLILFPLMGNILLLDIFYGIFPALPAAFALLGAGLYLFLYDIRAFWHYAFGAPFVRSATPQLATRVHGIKYAFVPAALLGALALAYTISQNLYFTTPLTGIWQFTGDAQWSRLYFDLGPNCGLRTTPDQGRDEYLQCTVDQQAKTVTLQGYPGSDVQFAFSGSYELSADGNRLTLRESDTIYELERLPSNHAIKDRLGIGGQTVPDR